jgi:deoxycytidylate deaminase
VYKYDEVMIETAKIFARLSYCEKKNVGAVLARDGRILATGYNGTISGMPNQCEDITYECNFCHKKVTEMKDLVEVHFLQKVKDPYKEKLLVTIKYECKHCGFNSEATYDDSDLQSMGKDGILNIEYLDTIRNYSKSKLAVTRNSKTSPFTMYAEQNIIAYCAKKGITTNGATMYITMAPDEVSAKLIAQSGIERLVYVEDYKNDKGIKFLKDCGIDVDQYSNSIWEWNTD